MPDTAYRYSEDVARIRADFRSLEQWRESEREDEDQDGSPSAQAEGPAWSSGPVTGEIFTPLLEFLADGRESSFGLAARAWALVYCLKPELLPADSTGTRADRGYRFPVGTCVRSVHAFWKKFPTLRREIPWTRTKSQRKEWGRRMAIVRVRLRQDAVVPLTERRRAAEIDAATITDPFEAARAQIRVKRCVCDEQAAVEQEMFEGYVHATVRRTAVESI